MQPALQCIFPIAFKIQIAKAFSVISPWHRRSISSLSTQTCLRIDIRKLVWATQEGGKSKAINSSSLALLSHLPTSGKKAKENAKGFLLTEEKNLKEEKKIPPIQLLSTVFFLPQNFPIFDIYFSAGSMDFFSMLKIRAH